METIRKCGVESVMNKKILVVGGSGAVGSVVATRLASSFPGRVLLGGRNFNRIQALADKLNGAVAARCFDANNPRDWGVLDDVGCAIVCMDLNGTGFVERCLELGIRYVDVSASNEQLKLIKALAPQASANSTTAVLSVGLAPGLTNLLAKHACQKIGTPARIRINILLGLGEKHGKAAIGWTLRNLARPWSISRNGVVHPVESFTGPEDVSFPQPIGRRRAYLFNFPEQHTLPETLAVDDIETRLCFDSRFFTSLFAALKKVELFRLLRWQPLEQRAVELFHSVHLGSDIFAVQVVAVRQVKSEPVRAECSVWGQNEALVTGSVAANVVRLLEHSTKPPGVFHIEELFDLDEFTQQMGLECHWNL